ncbi:MAG TPA: ThuA domain-containing protein [Myxococcota bacterium]|nr:ThuA domain-containing protein [Myxococcota bacterium]
MTRALAAVLVCGGRFHDFDYARLELLKHLGADARVRTRVESDWSRADAWSGADFLLTYTCDLRPTTAQADELARFVERGGRWFALHGTNSILEIEGRKVACPRLAPRFMQVLGSQFLAHPPIAPYQVSITDPTHPLVKGIAPFETSDELYVSELHSPVQTLLETRFGGRTPGFEPCEWPEESRPVLYLHEVGAGAVLYLTLGHCRGHYDMRPMVDYYPVVERGSWELPVFHELLRRGLAWAKREAL